MPARHPEIYLTQYLDRTKTGWYRSAFMLFLRLIQPINHATAHATASIPTFQCSSVDSRDPAVVLHSLEYVFESQTLNWFSDHKAFTSPSNAGASSIRSWVITTADTTYASASNICR